MSGCICYNDVTIGLMISQERSWTDITTMEQPPKPVSPTEKELKPVIEPEKGNVRMSEDVEEQRTKNLEEDAWREQE
jgi:hypothetical protein